MDGTLRNRTVPVGLYTLVSARYISEGYLAVTGSMPPVGFTCEIAIARELWYAEGSNCLYAVMYDVRSDRETGPPSCAAL